MLFCLQYHDAQSLRLLYYESDPVSCKLCPKELNKPKDGAQAGIIYHLRTVHPTDFALVGSNKRKRGGVGEEPAIKKPYQPTIAQSFNRFAENKIHRALAQYIAVDCVPIRAVEKPGFMNLVKKLRPQFHIKGRNAYSRTHISELHEEYEEKLKKELASIDHVALGIDLWSDEGGKKQVIGVLVLFQLGESLVHRILDVIDIADISHTGDTLASRTADSIDKYSLNGKVAALVRDGASNVKLAGKLLAIPHFDCFNHRLHLAAMDGMEALGDMSNIIQKFKKIARKLKKSHTAQREFANLQGLLDLPPLTLKKSIDVRWNSIYDMLRRAINCKQALCLYLADQPSWPQIASSEWDSIHSLCEVPAALKDVSDIAQSRGNHASTVIPVLSILIERMNSEHSCASVRAAISKRLVDTLEVYKQNEFLVLATCLDPRFKINFLDATFKELLHAKVLEILDESTEDTNEKPVEEEEDDPFLRPVQGDEPASVEQQVDPKIAAQLEVEKWLRTPPNSKAHVFKYWKNPMNIGSFPNLHKLASIYHSTHPGTAEVERAFSTAGFILNDLRKNLSHETFGMLLKLNKNVQIYGFD